MDSSLFERQLLDALSQDYYIEAFIGPRLVASGFVRQIDGDAVEIAVCHDYIVEALELLGKRVRISGDEVKTVLLRISSISALVPFPDRVQS